MTVPDFLKGSIPFKVPAPREEEVEGFGLQGEGIEQQQLQTAQQPIAEAQPSFLEGAVPFKVPKTQAEKREVPEEEREGFLKSVARTLFQPSLGALEFSPVGIGTSLFQLLATGEAISTLEELDDPRIAELRRKFPSAPWPEKGKEIDREKLLSNIEAVSESIPTIANLGDFIEEKTGIPLTPKNKLQKVLRFASGVGRLKTGSLTKKVTAATKATITKEGLMILGVPEEAADVLAIGGALFEKTPAVKVTERVPSSLHKELAEVTGEPPPPPDLPPQKVAQKVFRRSEKPPPPPTAGRLRERIKIEKDLGLKETPRPSFPKSKAIEDEVGDLFSKRKFQNSRHGGENIANEVKNIDNNVYNEIRKNYKKSETLNEGIVAPRPKLIQKLRDKLSKIEKISDKSTVSKSLVKSLRNIINDLIEVGPEGTVTRLKPISNQKLIKQVQELREKIDFDFAHGKPKNKFKPLISDIQAAVEEAASGPALDALKKANKSYSQWTDMFDNDVIRTLRDRSNKEFSKIFTNSQKLDNISRLDEILKQTPKGKLFSDIIKRDIANKRLAPFYEKLDTLKGKQSFDSKEFAKELSEIRSVTSNKQASEINKIIQKHRKPSITKKVTEVKKIKGEPFKFKTPEEIRSKFSTRSGVKEVREEFKRIGKENLFRRQAEQHIEDLFRKGKVSGKRLTGNDLHNILTERNNFEVLSELMGEETVKSMIKESKLEGSRALNKAKAVKIAKAGGILVGSLTVGGKFLKILINALL